MAKLNTIDSLYKSRMSNPMLFGRTEEVESSKSQLKRTPQGAILLKYARQFRGLTQAESAAHYGIEERTLRRWENNEFNPKWNDVVALIEDVYMMEITEVIMGIRSEALN